MSAQDPDVPPKPPAPEAVAPANGAAPKPLPPESTPPEAAELVDDIEAYQKRMEREWASAKEVYQSRISEIMDDFLKKDIGEVPPVNGHGAAPHKAAGPAPDSMETLVARVAQELRAMDSRGRPGAGAPNRPLLPGPVTKSSLHKRAAVLGLIALAITAGAIGLQMPEWTPLPYARTGAIAAFGDKLYVADWFKKSLYVHAAKRGAPIVSVESLPGGLVTGLQPAGDALWTVDGLSREIVRHAATPDHQVLERFPAPDARPAALALDGEDLWVAGLESKILYRLRADDPADVRDQYDLPIENVTALQLQNKRLWLLDGKSREISVYRLQKPLKHLATIDLDPFLEGATPTGLALSGGIAWIVTENPSAIARLSVAKIKKSRSSEF